MNARVVLDASSELAPSKPEVTPYSLALMHQQSIKEAQTRAETEAGLIRHLMIGRHVRVKGTDVVWLVLEVRMAHGWRAVLWGKRRGKQRRQAIGALHEVEIVNLGEAK